MEEILSPGSWGDEVQKREEELWPMIYTCDSMMNAFTLMLLDL